MVKLVVIDQYEGKVKGGCLSLCICCDKAGPLTVFDVRYVKFVNGASGEIVRLAVCHLGMA